MWEIIKLLWKARKMKDLYAVEYQTTNRLEPKLFAYEYCEEDYNTKELIFTNESAKHVLTLNKEKLEWYTTMKLGENNTFYSNN